MVCHIGAQLGTKVVISALGILALYMRFNGTGIWGSETIRPSLTHYRSLSRTALQVSTDLYKNVVFLQHVLS